MKRMNTASAILAALVPLLGLAAAPAAFTAAQAKDLKPKFGDIPGVYYPEVSGERENCREAITYKIGACRQNVNFASNARNRKYAGCLRIFRSQSEWCVDHFRKERVKCEGSGPADIKAFTHFLCTVTETTGTGTPEDAAPEGRQRPSSRTSSDRSQMRCPEGYRGLAGPRWDLKAVLERQKVQFFLKAAKGGFALYCVRN